MPCLPCSCKHSSPATHLLDHDFHDDDDGQCRPMTADTGQLPTRAAAAAGAQDATCLEPPGIFFLFFYFTYYNIYLDYEYGAHEGPTRTHDSRHRQQWPMQANTGQHNSQHGQQRSTLANMTANMANKGQHWPMRAHNTQHKPTQAHKIQHRPMKANEG